jgi:uncharacterized membrane protein YqhA
MSDVQQRVPTPRSRPVAQRVERGFESLLWNSRLLMLVAVVGAAGLAVTALVLAIADTAYLIGRVGSFATTSLGGEARDELRTQVITAIVKALDGFLIAALLIIVALGLYEIFVSRNDPAQNSSASRQLLRVTDLEDLKQRVGKLIVLVLVVEFFQLALQLPVRTSVDLLYLAVGVLLVSGALYLTGRHGGGHES